ncbi:hypothetical protein WH47_11075 [Habropoda laboriosa]|uniref:Uncharacterized protein n=1 Tax=Habropoda laboriosa TaxID=597456 RepID=A0A0L7QM21_9HYME|nr:hypothetical protein WH47_11075 [Habropoda laboriosa]
MDKSMYLSILKYNLKKSATNMRITPEDQLIAVSPHLMKPQPVLLPLLLKLKLDRDALVGNVLPPHCQSAPGRAPEQQPPQQDPRGPTNRSFPTLNEASTSTSSPSTQARSYRDNVLRYSLVSSFPHIANPLLDVPQNSNLLSKVNSPTS